ncbi:hypothetical protein [Bradyrhizobium genosp. A]|uniref:hypothetical protein n=1 Tax=Bradyrhizobium genosp. A TaxID=83626 RepID=UPI003CF620DD
MMTNEIGLSRRMTLAGLATFQVVLPATAAVDRDPIFAAIDLHSEMSTRYDAAVSVSAKLEEGAAFDVADKISGERCAALKEHAGVLIRSKPTTIAGVACLSRYVASLGAWQLPDDETWHQVLLRTLADAIEEIGATYPTAR